MCPLSIGFMTFRSYQSYEEFDVDVQLNDCRDRTVQGTCGTTSMYCTPEYRSCHDNKSYRYFTMHKSDKHCWIHKQQFKNRNRGTNNGYFVLKSRNVFQPNCDPRSDICFFCDHLFTPHGHAYQRNPSDFYRCSDRLHCQTSPHRR